MTQQRPFRRWGLLTVLSGIMSAGVQAGTPVEFSGTLVSEPCQVATDSQEITVDFGSIATQAFINSDRTEPKNFSIHLIECDLTSGSQVSVTFIGNESASQPGTFSVVGDAQGVVVAVEDSNGNAVVPNEALPATGLSEDETVLKYRAWLQAANVHQLTEGEFASVVTFALAYE